MFLKDGYIRLFWINHFTFSIMATVKNKSMIWDHFERKNDLAICKLCKREYTFSGSTSTMIRHLSKVHFKVIDETTQRTATQKTLHQCVPQPVQKYSSQSKEHIEITKIIAEMIVKDMRPFDWSQVKASGNSSTDWTQGKNKLCYAYELQF